MRIKICGLTRVDDALMVAEAGANWIGLNFYPPSPRFIEPAIAREIVRALPESATPVGLFVNSPPDEIADLSARLGLEIIQLHGQEPPEDLRKLSHLTIIRAFRLHDVHSIDEMITYLKRAAELGRMPDAILVDGFVADSPGGTGVAIAEHLLGLLPSVPRLILAGGLNPGNVADRVRKVRPWMVDVASGVESTPGRKDPAKVKAFIESAHGVARPAASGMGSSINPPDSPAD
jgi:phosphoribosylanthranilate isomerase